MKSFLRALLVVIVLAAIGGGAFWLYQNRSQTASTSTANASFAQTVSVTQGNLSATISVVGELSAVQDETLAFDRLKGNTPMLTLAVAAGNVVTANQVLATIDPQPYQQALDQARSDLQAAEQKLADLKTPATDLAIAKVDLAVAQAQFNLQKAQDDLDNLLHPDIATLQSKVDDAQLALAQAQADLAALQADTSTADKLVTLRDRADSLTAEYNRLATESYSDTYHQDRLAVAYNKALDAQDSVATTETQAQISLLQASMKVRQAEVKLADAGQALADAQAGGSELELAKANLAVKTAEVNLADAQQKRADLDAGADPTALAAAQADLDKKRLAVADAEADLAGATLRAPFSGTILSTYVAQGDLTTANTEILTIANLNELEVLAAVDETTIRQVKTGQQAAITFDAFPGQTFTGQALSIPLQGTLQGGVMVYEVPISLQGAGDLSLLVGMTANVSIQVGQVENALLIPTMAVQTIGGTNQVEIPGATPEDPTQAVPVEIGLSNGVYTQIVRGLNLGDQVVVQMQASQTQQFGFPGGGGAMSGALMGGGRAP